jgi:hypothetical protein
MPILEYMDKNLNHLCHMALRDAFGVGLSYFCGKNISLPLRLRSEPNPSSHKQYCTFLCSCPCKDSLNQNRFRNRYRKSFFSPFFTELNNIIAPIVPRSHCRRSNGLKVILIDAKLWPGRLFQAIATSDNWLSRQLTE